METMDDVKLYFCKNCCSTILYINFEEQELLAEFKDESVLVKRIFDYYEETGYNVQSYARDMCEKKYKNLITAQVLSVRTPRAVRVYSDAGRIKDYHGRNYDLAVDVRLTKNPENYIQFFSKDEFSTQCPLCSKGDIEKIDLYQILDISYYDFKKREEKHNENRVNLENFFHNLVLENKKLFIDGNINNKSGKKFNSDNVNVQELLLNLINTEKNINFLEEELEVLMLKEMEQKRLISSFVNTIRNVNISKTFETISEIINEPKKPEEPKEPVLRKIGFFTKRSDNEYNEILLKDYELNKQKYFKEMNEYQKDLELYNNEKQKQNKKVKEIIDGINTKIANFLDYNNKNNEMKFSEDLKISKDNEKNLDLIRDGYMFLNNNINEIKQHLIELYSLKNDLISLNVIYPKYNNLIAWATMYEYFTTGRVTSLTGSDGAYNLYESEIRANLIILQLDTISDKLDTIKDNQYMLYSVMTDINNNLHSLNSKMDVELTLSAITVFNTTKTAYYTKLTAEKTDAIAWLTALK